MSEASKPHSVQDDFAALRAEAAWRIPHVRVGLDAAISRIEEQLEAVTAERDHYKARFQEAGDNWIIPALNEIKNQADDMLARVESSPAKSLQ